MLGALVGALIGTFRFTNASKPEPVVGNVTYLLVWAACGGLLGCLLFLALAYMLVYEGPFAS